MIDGSISFVMNQVNHSVHESMGSALTYDVAVSWDPADAKIHIRSLDYILGGPRSKSLLFELGDKGATSGRLIATGLNLWQTYDSTIAGGFEAPEKAYMLWKLLEHAFS